MKTAFRCSYLISQCRSNVLAQFFDPQTPKLTSHSTHAQTQPARSLNIDATQGNNNVDELNNRVRIKATSSLATMAPDSRYHLRSRSATTNLTTMLRDSVLRRYDLRPRPAVTYSQTVSRSARQQKRYRRSKRALLNPTAPSPPSLSTLQLTRVPYLPPEIVCMILSYYSNHNEAITLLPTRASIAKQAAFNERMSRLPPK